MTLPRSGSLPTRAHCAQLRIKAWGIPGMAHEHSHNDHHGGNDSGVRLLVALGLTLAFGVIEAGAGWWSGSLALLGDAGHMVTDSLSLGLAAVAERLARRPASARHSYGLQRSEVLAGLVNTLLMLALIVALSVAAVQRLLAPQPIHGEAVTVVAGIGLAVNIFVALMLSRGEQSFNMRGALLHVLGDLLGSVAALIAGLVITFSGWTPIDPILSLCIAALILASTVRLLLETLHTLMEGVPQHLSLDEIGRAMAAHPKVQAVHDLHLWTVSSRQVALSAHLVVEDLRRWQEVLADVSATLHELGIDHVTLQPEPLLRPVHWAPRGSMPKKPIAPHRPGHRHHH